MIEGNGDNFDQIVIEASKTKPVLVDFWAPWCGPCTAMTNILEDAKEELKDIDIVKINVDNNKRLAVAYNIRSIPTLILFKNGEMVKQTVGLINKEELLNTINSI